MLGEFITANRGEIISRCRSRNSRRLGATAIDLEFAYGVPLFLDQLVEALGQPDTPHTEMKRSACKHAEELWRGNFTIAQVVRDYGSVCQTIMELAIEARAEVPASAFKTMNLCLDDAIAEAATEFDRLQDQAGRERLGQLAADRMASVGMLAAGIVHEINNPLTAVLANLHLAVEDAAMPASTGEPRFQALQEELRDSIASAERIRNIVRNVRVFSACSATYCHAVAIEPVLESSLRIASNEIRHRAHVARNYEAALAPVYADESRLGQVFLNLLVNAAQSIEAGNAARNEIGVITRMDGSLVVVEIRDSGVGIPAAQLPNLFTPFFSTKDVAIGTGLGLSICHRIVTDLGGTIAVESVVGRGSTFRVSLPGTKGEIVAATRAQSEVVVPPRRGCVLVIDDEALVGNAARRILSRQHEVVQTTSAREALDWIGAGRHFDVILCDLMMPDLSGQDFFAELLSVAPAQSEKVVFMTGGAFTTHAAGFLAGISSHRLEKPFDAIGLRNIVNRAIAMLPGQSRTRVASQGAGVSKTKCP